jgi:hypothetical protein
MRDDMEMQEIGTLTLGQWRVLEPHVRALQEAQRGLNVAIAAIGLPVGCQIDPDTGTVRAAVIPNPTEEAPADG